jgi:uncharacterized protein (TIGR03435 family)
MARTAVGAFALLMTLASPGLRAQSPVTPGPATPPLRFEVASVKRTTTNDGRGSFISPAPGGRFVATSASLRHIIQVVYGVPPYALLGGPDWLDSTRYDIEAKAATDLPMTQIYSMVRGLLAERFQLSVRMEQRDTPGYALVVARSDGRLGPSLTKLEGGCDTTPREPGRPMVVDGLPPCNRMFNSDRAIGMNGRPLDEFARALSPHMGRPVANRTGLDGVYILRFRWEPELDAAAPGQASAPSQEVSLFTALEEQLGLKLVGERTTMDAVVIEHVERPTEN